MIVKMNVTQQVVEYFVKQIQSGSWKVGGKIPSENFFKKELGVSRTSIRTAIQQLIGISILKSVQGKGTFLLSNNLSFLGKAENIKTDVDYVDMTTLLEFRMTFEPEICYLAMERISDESIANMRFYLQKMNESIGNRKDFVRYDILFHEEIINSTNNPLVVEAIKNVFMKDYAIIESENEVFGYNNGIYYHTLILKAFEARDASKARRLMRSHLQKALDDITYEEVINCESKSETSK